MSTFHTVEAAAHHTDGFVLIGLFTKPEDAEAFRKTAEASGDYLAVTPPQELKMEVVLDMLVRDRLRELADPINQLATYITKGTRS